jgi:hypothetical protein
MQALHHDDNAAGALVVEPRQQGMSYHSLTALRPTSESAWSGFNGSSMMM